VKNTTSAEGECYGRKEGDEGEGRPGEGTAGKKRGEESSAADRGSHLRKLRRNPPVVRKSALIKAVSSGTPLSRPILPRPSPLAFK
jgi:hypothetical protein